MDLHDKRIPCADCGTDCSFTAEEQESLQSRGYADESERCPSFRQARKTGQHGSSGNSCGLQHRTFRARSAGRERDAEVPLAFPTGRQSYYSGYLSRIRLTD